MQTSQYALQGRRGLQVLFAHGQPGDHSHWLIELHEMLKPRGLELYPTSNSAETIRRVERGGLAAAVLIADERQIHGLSLLSIIRSIDDDLPCCLVTADIDRPSLQTALTLRATSVMTMPIECGELSMALQQLLVM